jgi:hypothetical protein
MAGCPYFLAITYAHFLAAGLVSVLAVKLDLIKKLGLGNRDYKTELILFIIAIALLLVIIQLQPGILKYFFYFLFIIFMGTSLRGLLNKFNAEDILIDVLVILSTVFFALTALAVYDKNQNLSFYAYLSVCLGAMILSRLGINLTVLVGYPTKSISGLRHIISVAVTFFASIFLAYDSSRLKELAELCAKGGGKTDYVHNAMSVYLNIIGMFFDVKKLKIHQS